MTNTNIRSWLFLLALGGVVFIVGNGALPLTNPDEVFYALTAREMIQHHSWLTPYLFDQPQFEKPILTFWLLRLSFAAIGINPFAARLPPAVFAVIGGLVTRLLGRLIWRDDEKAFLSALMLMTAGLYVGLGRFLLTDMIFSVFILAALTAFYAGAVLEAHRKKGILLFFFFCALAVLTKGILGLILPLGVVASVLVLEQKPSLLFGKTALTGVLLFLAVCGPWYGYMIGHHDGAFVHEFFYNDHIRRLMEAEHRGNDTWFFYPVVLTAGMMPWSIFMLWGLAKSVRSVASKTATSGRTFLMSWIGVVFVVFQAAHSKLASYILPMSPALALLAGDAAADLMMNKRAKTLTAVILISCLPMAGAAVVLALIGRGWIPFAFDYYQYMPDGSLIRQFFIIVLCLTAASVVLSRRHRPKTAVLIMSLQIPVLLTAALLAKNKFEDYVSSRSVGRYLTALKAGRRAPILCSKMFVRGVRYHTGAAVASLGSPFFSPHPIPTLTEPHEILEFCRRFDKIWAVVREGDKDTLERTLAGEFMLRTRMRFGDAYVLDIQRMKKPPTV